MMLFCCSWFNYMSNTYACTAVPLIFFILLNNDVPVSEMQLHVCITVFIRFERQELWIQFYDNL